MSGDRKYKRMSIDYIRTKLANSKSMDDVVDGLQEIRDNLKEFIEGIGHSDWSEADESVIRFGYEISDIAVGIKLMASTLISSGSTPSVVEVAYNANKLANRILMAAIEVGIAYGRGEDIVKIHKSMEELKEDLDNMSTNSESGSVVTDEDIPSEENWDPINSFLGGK
jgi:hypothetical protein